MVPDRERGMAWSHAEAARLLSMEIQEALESYVYRSRSVGQYVSAAEPAATESPRDQTTAVPADPDPRYWVRRISHDKAVRILQNEGTALRNVIEQLQRWNQEKARDVRVLADVLQVVRRAVDENRVMAQSIDGQGAGATAGAEWTGAANSLHETPLPIDKGHASR